jgi:hypothetical protein
MPVIKMQQWCMAGMKMQDGCNAVVRGCMVVCGGEGPYTHAAAAFSVYERQGLGHCVLGWERVVASNTRFG